MKLKIAMATLLITMAMFWGNLMAKDRDDHFMMDDNPMIATLAGGCFWCTESDFEKVDGVIKAISGYTGGHVHNPGYHQVSGGGTGHYEAVQVYFDPGRISYAEILNVFWRHVDPTDAGGQFVDRGDQYRSGIFYHDEAQKRTALESRKKLSVSGVFKKKIVTEVIEFDRFYPAEDYHQDYYKKNPVRYKYYRFNSGRDQFLAEAWKGMEDKIGGKAMSAKEKKYSKPDDAVLKEKLTPLQYKVTQHEGTERSFNNEYWDNKEAGIYVDIVSGEPLFSSTEKYKSGTGWPSFYKPLEPKHIVEKTDNSLFTSRVEVRSKYGDSHLGHVFPDGPEPTGLRYCINSASLRFIPVDQLAVEGYGDYLNLFE